MFFKVGVLKNFVNFTEKKSDMESLFNKVAGLNVCKVFLERLHHRCFPVKFTKFSRTPSFTERL